MTDLFDEYAAFEIWPGVQRPPLYIREERKEVAAAMRESWRRHVEERRGNKEREAA
jgi:hypothetical protein